MPTTNNAYGYTKKGRVGFSNSYKLKFDIKFHGTPELAIQMIERLQQIFPEISEISFRGLGIDGPPVPVSQKVVTEYIKERKVANG
jgi:hypothetical protein